LPAFSDFGCASVAKRHRVCMLCVSHYCSRLFISLVIVS
jgi:hypothetical protein